MTVPPPESDGRSFPPRETLGSRDRGPFAPNENEALLTEKQLDRTLYAEAFREELRAVVQRRTRWQKPPEGADGAFGGSVAQVAPEGDAASKPPLSRWRRWLSRGRAIAAQIPGAIGDVFRRWRREARAEGPCRLPDELDASTANATRSSLAGLALSGGGIRSATFALGALQALAERKALGAFDFCSTVSGGGFTGGWWSAWLSRKERKPKDGIFPADERLEPDRYPAMLLQEADVQAGSNAKQEQHATVPDGSRSVMQHDPIHHLRLFSNYLTPRSGLLSGDTWRAITIISRNVVLTWLILIPVVLSAVLMGQLYFAGRDDVGYAFACSRPDGVPPAAAAAGTRSAPVIRIEPSTFCLLGPSSAAKVVYQHRFDSTAQGGRYRVAATHTVNGAWMPHRAVLLKRLSVLAAPLFSAAIILTVCTILWMLYSSQTMTMTALNFFGLALLVYILVSSDGTDAQSVLTQLWTEQFYGKRWGFATLGVVILLLAVLGVGPWMKELWKTASDRANAKPREFRVSRDQVRNAIVRWHSRATLVFLAWILGLLIVGFGHEISWFLFDPQTGQAAASARKAGGWTALAITTWSALLTFVKAFPSTKAQDAGAKEPALPSRIAMAVAPVLTVLAMTIACATAGRWILAHASGWSETGYAENGAAARALLTAVLFMLVFSLAEWVERPGTGGRKGAVLRALEGIGILAVLGGVIYWYMRGRSDGGLAASYTALSLSIAVLIWRYADADLTRTRKAAVLAGGALGAALTVLFLKPFLVNSAQTSPGMFITALGLLGVLSLLLFIDWVIRDEVNHRATTLATIALAGSFALVLLHHLPRDLPVIALRTTALGWAGFLIAWVIGLGWTIDPNLVSLNNFYKSRLVRAYLGASNAEERRHHDISETAPNDDVLLRNLANHCHGAPVHLVNATLNLVGGRDLATAQRSAALFTMSSQVCGSARTGYHHTAEYMDGTLSLGSAIAASGAAVSPTMGAKSVSSSLALLLALFNVRLGFWVPTPNRRRWRERQPTLWPFYLLSEAFSQTNDLGTYCYLTDGGHFDNTGVYALIERGCRYIYVLDDGADPTPCFSDMGDLIRRCRIDFGAEIDLVSGIATFGHDTNDGIAKSHTALGTITYRPAHLRMLGWSEEDIATKCRGYILWIKPTVTRNDSVDVQQYRLENSVFPQQTTTDQWYDEAQFESYRALGYQSVSEWLKELRTPVDINDPQTLFGRRRGKAVRDVQTSTTRWANVGL
jgi:hypothetical protein